MQIKLIVVVVVVVVPKIRLISHLLADLALVNILARKSNTLTMWHLRPETGRCACKYSGTRVTALFHDVQSILN